MYHNCEVMILRIMLAIVVGNAEKIASISVAFKHYENYQEEEFILWADLANFR